MKEMGVFPFSSMSDISAILFHVILLSKGDGWFTVSDTTAQQELSQCPLVETGYTTSHHTSLYLEMKRLGLRLGLIQTCYARP